MDDVERLLIERDITRLSHDYARLVDFGRASEVADLFAPGSVLELSAGRFEGLDAIRAFFTKRQAQTNVVSRHVSTNITIDVVDGDHATGVIYLTFYRVVWDGEGPAPLGTPSYIGAYHDEYVRLPEGWRFQSRLSSVALRA